MYEGARVSGVLKWTAAFQPRTESIYDFSDAVFPWSLCRRYSGDHVGCRSTVSAHTRSPTTSKVEEASRAFSPSSVVDFIDRIRHFRRIKSVSGALRRPTFNSSGRGPRGLRPNEVDTSPARPDRSQFRSTLGHATDQPVQEESSRPARARILRQAINKALGLELDVVRWSSNRDSSMARSASNLAQSASVDDGSDHRKLLALGTMYVTVAPTAQHALVSPCRLVAGTQDSKPADSLAVGVVVSLLLNEEEPIGISHSKAIGHSLAFGHLGGLY